MAAAATVTKESTRGSTFCTISAAVIEYDNGTRIGGTNGDTMITIQSMRSWSTIFPVE